MPPNWIDRVMEDCEHVETPRSWLWWSLLTVVSAAAGNKYYMSVLKGAVIVKPNLYVILLGESGLGKEFPIWLATELADRMNTTRVIAGRSSIQAIVKELSLHKTRENAEPIEDSRGFIVNGELSTAIISDPDALTILTDLYDRKTKWANLLKGDGEEKLKDPYISCLFGSSPAHFYDSVPQVNIEGGYIGRNLMVYEEKRAKDTDMFSEDEDQWELPLAKHINFLQQISHHGGRVIPTPDAKEFFNDWRRAWRKEGSHDKTGFHNRVPVHALKVAINLCLADDKGCKNLLVTQAMMDEAISAVTSLVYSNKRTSEGKGPDPLAVPTKAVLDLLTKAPDNQLRKKQLLNRGYGQFDNAVLDKVIEYLMEMKWITRDLIRAGSNTDWIITLAGEPLEQYRQFLKRKQG
jgi:hypothetical protein